MTEVYLFRHAESDWNLNNSHLIGGRSNFSPLTPKGVEQAKILGRYLLSEDIQPTQIHVSPAVRTLQTMEYSLAEMGMDIEHVVHDALQELSHGSFEGQDRQQIFTDEMKAERTLLKKDFKLPDPQAESMNDVGHRMMGWFNTEIVPTAEESARHFVYTHGFAIRCMIGDIENWTDKEIFEKYKTPNVCITKLVHDRGEWNLEYYAQVPPELAATE